MKSNLLGDLGESVVVTYALRKGYIPSRPWSGTCKYDLIIDKQGHLYRTQVKTVTPKNGVLQVPFQTVQYAPGSGSNNRTQNVRYSHEDFDIVAVVDASTLATYFIPVSEFTGATLSLRLEPPKNNQQKNVTLASTFGEW